MKLLADRLEPEVNVQGDRARLLADVAASQVGHRLVQGGPVVTWVAADGSDLILWNDREPLVLRGRVHGWGIDGRGIHGAVSGLLAVLGVERRVVEAVAAGHALYVAPRQSLVKQGLTGLRVRRLHWRRRGLSRRIYRRLSATRFTSAQICPGGFVGSRRHADSGITLGAPFMAYVESNGAAKVGQCAKPWTSRALGCQ